MPNWRKHSASMVREDSPKSTRAVRATDFRVVGDGGRTEAKLFVMGGDYLVKAHSGAGFGACERYKRATSEVPKCHYLDCPPVGNWTLPRWIFTQLSDLRGFPGPGPCLRKPLNTDGSAAFQLT